MSDKVCPKCRNTIAANDDRYCYLDGTEMVKIPACECGRSLVAHDRFCPKCGKKVPVADVGTN